MRNSLEFLRRFDGIQHLDLAYGMLAPVAYTGEEEGKIPKDNRDDWFSCLEKIQISPDYRGGYTRWKNSFSHDKDIHLFEITLRSRLLLGHGNPAPTDVGLTVHHTWGVPMLPGPSIKGVVSHYLEASYGPKDNKKSPFDEEHPEPDRRIFQGVRWEGKRIEHGPGLIYRELFGAPAARTDNHFPIDADAQKEVFPSESRGTAVFYDAWMIPPDDSDEQGKTPFIKDILTVHQRSYYESFGEKSPNDWDDPNPVAFLTVRPGTRFLLAYSVPKERSEMLLSLLKDSLDEWGIGGKTSAGYGRFSKDWEEVRLKKKVRIPKDSVVFEFEKAFDTFIEGGPGVKGKMKFVKESWEEKLLALENVDERVKAWEIIKGKSSVDGKPRVQRNGSTKKWLKEIKDKLKG